MRIAIFDNRVVRHNAIGFCHLQVLKGLCYEHEFTVFAISSMLSSLVSSALLLSFFASRTNQPGAHRTP